MDPYLLTLVCAVVATVGIIGIVVPVLPGTPLVLAALVGWAVMTPSWPARIITGVAVLVGLAFYVGQFVLAHRSMKTTGVPSRSMTVGILVGVIGMFTIPVVGLPLGFVVGLYAHEAWRLKDSKAAIRSAKAALKAVGIGMLVELIGATAAMTIWSVALAWFFVSR